MTAKRRTKKDLETSSFERPSCEVAIIGMSCFFPKAGDLVAYWENILNKVDSITEVPADRWDWRDYFDPDKTARDKIYSKWGGFMDPVVFNPMDYGIPPNNLRSIDPVQLLSLEVAHRALIHAGYSDREFDRAHTACIFGLAGGMGDFGLQYGFRASLPMFLQAVPEELLSQLPEWTEDSFPGVLPNVVTGRIANCLNLGGANFTVDAACASALTAVYAGVKEIVSGVSSMAIVGAADTLQNPHGFLCFSKTKALSATGQPKPFDASADGISISEGVGAMVLKRKDLALKDGDTIYAVIRGVGSSSDGRGRSLTAPQTSGQLRALKNAYDMAGLSIDTIELVEAHGTGTVVGDGTEAESMAQALKTAGAATKSCAIGSVKSNIGHTKGCAGVAGLIKATMALHHKVLPATLHVKKPSAEAFLDPDSSVFVNTENRPWISRFPVRRAGVNSFGFGGTNFHVVLEEHLSKASTTRTYPLSTWPCELFLWKGDSAGQIDSRLALLERGMQANQHPPRLRDLARHVYENRGKGKLGLAIVAESVNDLVAKVATARAHLKTGEAISDPKGIYYQPKPLGVDGKIAFLFPGQGSQRPDMMRDLAILFPELRDRFARADHVLADRLERRLSDYVYPPPRFSEADEKNAMTAITVTNIAQPSLGVTEMGMFHILRLLGIEPAMTAGHSSGEYSALCAAGVFSEDTLYEILEDRGSSILNSATGDLGTMMAVKTDRQQAEEILGKIPGVYVANYNSPAQTILSGLEKDLQVAGEAFKKKGLQARLIPVSCAFHSPIIEPARDYLAKKLNALDYKKPKVPVYANLSAEPYPEDRETILHLLTDHLIGSVRFVEQIERMYKDGARIFIEVGPGGVLSNLVGQILAGHPHAAVATDTKSPRHDLFTLQHALAQCSAQGVDIFLDALFEGRDTQALKLEDLESTTPPKPVSPVSWYVAPDRSWPIKEKRPTRRKLDLRPADEVARLAASAPAAAPATPTSSGSSMTDVMIQHQRTLADFLQQQREVMMAYLSGNAPAPSTLRPPQQLPTPQPPTPNPQPRTTNLEPRTNNPEPRTTNLEPRTNNPEPRTPNLEPRTINLEPLLIQLVAERTGYPPEMIDLNAGIEADLGIDSIKRLEVLIAFAKEIPGAPDDLPEQLNTSTTLAEVLEKVLAFAPAVGTAKTAPSSPAPAAAPAPVSAPASDLTSVLLDLVADRTGYPKDMLDLAAGIESDLGIDSIKRLEILIAFAKEIPGAPDDLPEQLNTSSTLAEVLQKAAAFVSPAAATTRPASSTPVPAAVPRPVSAPSSDLTSVLLTLVADRTGYPTDMLDLDAGIESDLGIDSIKRLEILIAFAKEIPGAPEDLPEQLNTSSTLGEVLKKAAAYAGGSVAASPKASAARTESPTPESATAAPGIHRGLVKLVTAPVKSKTWKPTNGVVVISDDGAGVADALHQRLADLNQPSVIIRDSDQTGKDNVYESLLSDASSVRAILDRIRKEHGEIGGIIHLLPIAETSAIESFTLDHWRDVVGRDIKGLFHLLRYAAGDLQKDGHKCAVALTAMGERSDNGALPQPEQPWHGGIMGLMKCVADEWTSAVCRGVDVSRLAKNEIVDAILEEMSASDGVREVYRRNGERYRAELARTPLDLSEEQLSIGANDVILLLGGARGITALVAQHLAESFQPTLILAGRSAWPKEESAITEKLATAADIKKALFKLATEKGEKPRPVEVEKTCQRILNDRAMRANVDAMKQAGAKVEYVSVDVTDEKGMTALIENVYATYGRLDGVINGAGIIEDKLIEDKNPASFDRVFDNKAQSVFLLSRLLKPESLKFLVLFSSIAGWFGNRGQSDYAAANEVLNRMAQYLDRHWQTRVMAIGWGPWDQTGMATDEVKRQFRERGVGLVAPDAGVRYMIDEIRYGRRSEALIVVEGELV